MVDPENRAQRAGYLNMLLFTPIGLPFLLFRVVFCSTCVILNGLLGSCTPSCISWLTKCISQILLGQFVSFDKKRKLKKKMVLVSNQISHLDASVLSLFYNFQPVQVSNIPSYIHSMFNFTKVSVNSEQRGKQIDALLRSGHPVLVVPEEQDDKTSQSCDWPFHDYNEIQPISVEVTRPIQIEPFFQGGMTDILWFFFAPFTVYDVTIMDAMKRGEDESPEQFSRRVKQEICLTSPTERRKKESSKEISAGDAKAAAEAISKIRVVGKLKQEVSDDEIKQHFVRIGNVDETIVYFVEGGFAKDQEKALKKKAFSRNPFQRHQSFQERKNAFIQRARENYLKKQNLLSA